MALRALRRETRPVNKALVTDRPLGADPAGKATKFPIVLVHGFTGSLTLWNFVDVPEALTADGHRVFPLALHPFGTPDTNAALIKVQVDDILRKTGAAKVNLVAHSKGGLDARAYIANFKAGDKVASLEDSGEGEGFLKNAPRDRMDVKLVGAAALVGHGIALLANDGLSTVDSAKWGEFLGCIPADHQDDVGRPGQSGVDSRSGFDHVRFYRQLSFETPSPRVAGGGRARDAEHQRGAERGHLQRVRIF